MGPPEVAAHEALGVLANALREEQHGQGRQRGQYQERLERESGIAAEGANDLRENANGQQVDPRQENGKRTGKHRLGRIQVNREEPGPEKRKGNHGAAQQQSPGIDFGERRADGMKKDDMSAGKYPHGE